MTSAHWPRCGNWRASASWNRLWRYPVAKGTSGWSTNFRTFTPGSRTTKIENLPACKRSKSQTTLPPQPPPQTATRALRLSFLRGIFCYWLLHRRRHIRRRQHLITAGNREEKLQVAFRRGGRVFIRPVVPAAAVGAVLREAVREIRWSTEIVRSSFADGKDGIRRRRRSA